MPSGLEARKPPLGRSRDTKNSRLWIVNRLSFENDRKDKKFNGEVWHSPLRCT